MSGRVFKLKMQQYAKQFDVDMDALARQTAQGLAELVVMGTPVDTGFLRGSWQPSVGSPVVAEGSIDPSGANAVSAIGLIVQDMRAGKLFWMTNNANYASFVEFGTSRMAGRFFVTDALKGAKGLVERLVKELGSK